MSLVRRILLLAAISIAGVALMAPLAARSAVPTPAVIEAALLPTVDPATVAAQLDRGGAADRGTLASVAGEPSSPGEALDPDPLPTPAAAPMEATLHVIATPAPPAPPAPPVAGGGVWDRLAQCESGGNWAINTGNGYYGGLQFSYATWHGYDGGEFAEYPHEATREQQIVVAERLHAQRGFQPWPACRVKLGLP